MLSVYKVKRVIYSRLLLGFCQVLHVFGVYPCYNMNMETAIIEQEKNNLSILDDNTRARIRTLYLDGVDNKEIQAILGIPTGTWDNFYYLNRYAFRDFMDTCKRERFLIKAERASDSFLDIPDDSTAKMLAIKQKEAEFVRETLLKDHGNTSRTEKKNININREPLDDKQKNTIDRILKRKTKDVKSDTETGQKDDIETDSTAQQSRM